MLELPFESTKDSLYVGTKSTQHLFNKTMTLPTRLTKTTPGYTNSMLRYHTKENKTMQDLDQPISFVPFIQLYSAIK